MVLVKELCSNGEDHPTTSADVAEIISRFHLLWAEVRSDSTLTASRDKDIDKFDYQFFFHSSLYTTRPSHRDLFTSLVYWLISEIANLGKQFKSYNESHSLCLYKKWLGDVLDRDRAILRDADSYDSTYVSIFRHEQNSDIIRTMWESWWPQMNSTHISLREVSTSLLDLHTLTHQQSLDIYDHSADSFYGIDDENFIFFDDPDGDQSIWPKVPDSQIWNNHRIRRLMEKMDFNPILGLGKNQQGSPFFVRPNPVECNFGMGYLARCGDRERFYQHKRHGITYVSPPFYRSLNTMFIREGEVEPCWDFAELRPKPTGWGEEFDWTNDG